MVNVGTDYAVSSTRIYRPARDGEFLSLKWKRLSPEDYNVAIRHISTKRSQSLCQSLQCFLITRTCTFIGIDTDLTLGRRMTLII